MSVFNLSFATALARALIIRRDEVVCHKVYLLHGSTGSINQFDFLYTGHNQLMEIYIVI